MNFRRKSLTILISAVAAIIISVSVISNLIFRDMTSRIEKSQLNMMDSIITYNLKRAEERASGRAEMIASSPHTRALFAAGDRDGLFNEYKDTFEQQREKYGIDQMQFHKSPSTSFLRMTNQEEYGNDVSKYRPLVVSVNRDGIPRRGFAISFAGPAILGITPLYAPDGKQLGSVEIGTSFSGILDGIKSEYGLESAIFVDEEHMHNVAKGVSKSVYTEQNRLGSFIRFHSTNGELITGLINDKDLELRDSKHFSREALGDPYGVVVIPLRIGNGDVLGMLVAADNFSASRAAQKRSATWQALMALIAITLLAAVIVVTIRGMFLSPLAAIAARFRSLTVGDFNRSIEEKEILCDELRELADNYETIRNQFKNNGDT